MGEQAEATWKGKANAEDAQRGGEATNAKEQDEHDGQNANS